jgi:hypothetical protein
MDLSGSNRGAWGRGHINRLPQVLGERAGFFVGQIERHTGEMVRTGPAEQAGL